MSYVVGSGWTQVTLLRTVGVGSPGGASFTPLSGGGRGPPLVLVFCHSLTSFRFLRMTIFRMGVSSLGLAPSRHCWSQ